MPVPPEYLITRLGPSCLPGYRTGRTDIVRPGDEVPLTSHIYDATEDGYPNRCLYIKSIEDLSSKNERESKKYLWLITAQGLYAILENTFNPYNDRKKPCHTSFFGAIAAYQGGELWFIQGGGVAINDRSGRYGALTPEQWAAVCEYFTLVGYDPVINLVNP